MQRTVIPVGELHVDFLVNQEAQIPDHYGPNRGKRAYSVSIKKTINVTEVYAFFTLFK